MSVHTVDGSSSVPTSTHSRPVSIHDLKAIKQRGERFAMVTAYDANAASILDDAGVPIMLVGDSLGMVVLGYESTVPVTLDEILHHTRAVARGRSRALVVTDLPFGTYQLGSDAAMSSAVAALKAGANAVKLEGGGETITSTRRLVAAGIPVMGHIGLTPQSMHQFGGYRVQGRDAAAAERLVADAIALEEAGAFSIVIECVPTDVGQQITNAVEVPTIGIGAGHHTDAQVLVWHDLLGLTSGRLPRFVKPYVNLRDTIGDAIKSFQTEVADGEYPGPEHQY
ncbi:MAG: 3-methyl-2-oxobutanoate hydroxymethyltransferase [Nitriliruptoraceae bacterium]